MEIGELPDFQLQPDIRCNRISGTVLALTTNIKFFNSFNVHLKLNILDAQLTELNELMKNEASDGKMNLNTFKFIIGHPENIMNKQILDQLRTATWSELVHHIVIDEAHCVVTWSDDFRPKYREIVELGAIFPEARIIALTATATTRMQKEIIRLLGMKNPSIISTTVDRSNIKYIVKRRPANSGKGGVEHSYDTVFRPIITESVEQKDAFPKTVVYCGLKWCGFGHELALKISPTTNREFAQYHAPLLPEV